VKKRIDWTKAGIGGPGGVLEWELEALTTDFPSCDVQLAMVRTSV
jgi:hypothetical protein